MNESTKRQFRQDVRDYYAQVGSWSEVARRLGGKGHKTMAWRIANDPEYRVKPYQVRSWYNWEPVKYYRPIMPEETRELISYCKRNEIDLTTVLQVGTIWYLLMRRKYMQRR